MAILPEGSPERGSHDDEMESLLSIVQALELGNAHLAHMLVLGRMLQLLLDAGEPTICAMHSERHEELRQEAFEALGYPGKRGA